MKYSISLNTISGCVFFLHFFDIFLIVILKTSFFSLWEKDLQSICCLSADHQTLKCSPQSSCASSQCIVGYIMLCQAPWLREQAGVRGSDGTHAETLYCVLVAQGAGGTGVSRTGAERPSEVQNDTEKARQELALVLVQSQHGVQDCGAPPADPSREQTCRTEAGRDRLGMFQFRLIWKAERETKVNASGYILSVFLKMLSIK